MAPDPIVIRRSTDEGWTQHCDRARSVSALSRRARVARASCFIRAWRDKAVARRHPASCVKKWLGLVARLLGTAAAFAWIATRVHLASPRHAIRPVPPPAIAGATRPGAAHP